MNRPSDYEQLVKLWDRYEDSVSEHSHHEEEFVSCEVCKAGGDARVAVINRLDQIMNLLQQYHHVLGELTLSIIQEVPLPRPEEVQKALREGLALLTKGEL